MSTALLGSDLLEPLRARAGRHGLLTETRTAAVAPLRRLIGGLADGPGRCALNDGRELERERVREEREREGERERVSE